MKSSDDRKLFSTLIGASASVSDLTTIPATQATSGDGRASLALGFPPETFKERSAGGSPPYGADMNGFLNLFSIALQYIQTGFLGQFDADFASAIGGYPAGAIVCGATAGTYWVSTADNNTTTPGASGALWQSLFANLIQTAQIAQSDSKVALLSVNQSASTLGPYATVEDTSGNTTNLVSTTYLTNYAADYIKTRTNIPTDSRIKYFGSNLNGDTQGAYLWAQDTDGASYIVPCVNKTSNMITAAITSYFPNVYSFSVAGRNTNTASTSLSFTPPYNGYLVLNYNAANSDSAYEMSSVTTSGSGYFGMIGTGNFGHSSVWVGNFICSVTKGQAVYINVTATATGTVPDLDIGGTGLLLPR